MQKPEKASPTEADFLFEMDPEPASESLTSWGGAPLLVRAYGSLGLPASVQRNVRIQQRQRGYDEASVVESFLILNALGGDCLEDFDRLREAAGEAAAMASGEGRHDRSRHHVLKNELAAGVLPCGRFGANAAWLRLAVLTHNVLTALKRLALPPDC